MCMRSQNFRHEKDFENTYITICLICVRVNLSQKRRVTVLVTWETNAKLLTQEF